MDKKALQQINYGLYIVSANNDGKNNGQIVNTVFQVTSEPPCVAVCINKNNLTFDFIDKSRKFSVSILEKDTPMLFIGKFGFKSGRDIDKFADTKFIIGKTGMPVVTEWALSYFECEVISQTDAGTHTIFIGKVVNDGILQENKEALTYEYYRTVKKGKSPKNAPTFEGNVPLIKKNEAE